MPSLVNMVWNLQTIGFFWATWSPLNVTGYLKLDFCDRNLLKDYLFFTPCLHESLVQADKTYNFCLVIIMA